MKNIPKKIYLQIGESLTPEEVSKLDFNDLFGVTWCEDKIYDTDIEFTISVVGQSEQLCPKCGSDNLETADNENDNLCNYCGWIWA